MDDFLPMLFFLLVIILGNVFDKKKPPAKRVPLPKPPEVKDIKIPKLRHIGEEQPPEATDAYAIPVQQEIQVNNPYQQYLERYGASKKRHAGADASTAAAMETSNERQGQNSLGAALGSNVTLAQGIVLAEVLGKPKALQGRQRGYGRRRY